MNSEPVKKVQKKKVLVDTAIVVDDEDDDNGDDIDIDNDNDPEWNPEDADWNGKLWNVQMDVDFLSFFLQKFDTHEFFIRYLRWMS